MLEKEGKFTDQYAFLIDLFYMFLTVKCTHALYDVIYKDLFLQ